jgi:hypothetical protein
MIDQAKIALIHIAKARCRLDDDSYRDLLKAEGGVDSSRDLDAAGFDRLMKRFQKLGFVSTAKQQNRDRRRNAYRLGTITRDQQDKIAKMYELLAEASVAAGQPGFHTMAACVAFNRRQCRKSFPQTVGDAMKVIEGQKKYLARLRADASSATLSGEHPNG